MAIATLSNVQWMVDLRLDTVHLVSPVLYIIPTIAITALNVAIFRQLKRLLHTDQFSSVTDEIKKVLFEIRLTNLIAIIFVGAQIAYAINACLVIVSWFSFLFFLSLLKFYCLFQFLFSDENITKFYKNPLDWETLYKFWAYNYSVMIIGKLLNCSLNFYAYMFLRYRNQRAETRLRQKRQQDWERKMVTMATTKNTNEPNLETA